MNYFAAEYFGGEKGLAQQKFGILTKAADKIKTSEDKSEATKVETKKEEIKKDTPEEKK